MHKLHDALQETIFALQIFRFRLNVGHHGSQKLNEGNHERARTNCSHMVQRRSHHRTEQRGVAQLALDIVVLVLVVSVVGPSKVPGGDCTGNAHDAKALVELRGPQEPKKVVGHQVVECIVKTRLNAAEL